MFAYCHGRGERNPRRYPLALAGTAARLGVRGEPAVEAAGHEDAAAASRRYGERRAALPYDIDGVVYKIDDLSLQRRLASSAGAALGDPRGNSPPNRPRDRCSEESKSRSGRTGALTPVARLSR